MLALRAAVELFAVNYAPLAPVQASGGDDGAGDGASEGDDARDDDIDELFQQQVQLSEDLAGLVDGRLAAEQQLHQLQLQLQELALEEARARTTSGTHASGSTPSSKRPA